MTTSWLGMASAMFRRALFMWPGYHWICLLYTSIELEGTNIKVNAVSPGFTKTNLNGYEGVDTLEQGAAQAVAMALIGPDGPSGTFTHATLGVLPW